MTHLNIVRAWKDEEYRLSLSEAERALLPGHPAGAIDLTDAALGEAAGGLALTTTGGWVLTDAYVCYSVHCTVFHCQPPTIGCPA